MTTPQTPDPAQDSGARTRTGGRDGDRRAPARAGDPNTAMTVGRRRLVSGHSPLDEVLGGGLPANAITLITGRPGSGKTILAQQYLFNTAHPERPGVYLSTVTEPLDKIVRFGQTLNFFDVSSIGTSVIYDSLAETLTGDGLSGVVDQITGIITQRRPGLIVIDSFKALQAFAADAGAFRRFLHTLANTLGAFPVTSLWVGEYDSAEISEGAEFAVADAIIDLTPTTIGQREIRYLHVRKLRGSTFRAGHHAYRLSHAGLHLYPRLADDGISQDYPLPPTRTSSGVSALDAMLADGYWPGASTLVAGPSGIGKTLMGLHFITHGAGHGEPGVIATLQENPSQLQRTASGFGWTLDHPGIHVLYRSPVDVYIDEWVYAVLNAVERTGARRVLIDSLNDVQLAATDPTRFREFVYSLIQRCSHQQISVMMTLEIPDLFATNRLSTEAISALSDNVVLLSYVRHPATIDRSITVLKTRGSNHDPRIQPFTITPTGLHLTPLDHRPARPRDDRRSEAEAPASVDAQQADQAAAQHLTT